MINHHLTHAINNNRDPEHPFPAAQQDCLHVIQAVLQEKKQVILMGDSAGGGLCINSLYQLFQLQITNKPVGCIMISPFVNLLNEHNRIMLSLNMRFIMAYFMIFSYFIH